MRELECTSGIGNTDILRLERGFYAKSDADRLARLTAALNLTLADVYALATTPSPLSCPASSRTCGPSTAT